MHVDTDFTITGRLARFGRSGMIQDTSKRLFGEFAACLQEELKGVEATGASTGDETDKSGAAEQSPGLPAPGTPRGSQPSHRPLIPIPIRLPWREGQSRFAGYRSSCR